MNLKDKVLNATLYSNKYKVDSSAVIIACYFNPLNITLRHKLFKEWYETIKHMPHYIVEGQHNKSNLYLDFVPLKNKMIISIESQLWHKESLLNNALEIVDLKGKYKYVFWLDTDIRFSNKNWLVDSCNVLRNGKHNFVQPFSLVEHLRENEEFDLKNKSNISHLEFLANDAKLASKEGRRKKSMRVWFSHSRQYHLGKASDENYETHGHVGMAWGAVIKDFVKVGFYDGALVGGADHVMAHAITKKENEPTCHSCIKKSFGETNEILRYTTQLSSISKGLGYVHGLLQHKWHGDIEKRDYFNRISSMTNELYSKSKLNQDSRCYEIEDDSLFVEYMLKREVMDDTPDTLDSNFKFGGGDFGGGGASGSWNNEAMINSLAVAAGIAAVAETTETTEITNTFS